MKTLLLGLMAAIFSVGCIDAEIVLEAVPTPDGNGAPVEPGILPTTTPMSTFQLAPTITPMSTFGFAPTITPMPTFQLAPTITPVPKRQGFGQGEPLRELGVTREFPGLSFHRPVALIFPEDDSERGFVVEQAGRIIALNGDAGADLFLDIRDRVNDRGEEEGLLGLAFDPDFYSNGYFYVYYTASGPRRSTLSRFVADGETADPNSETLILEVEQPYANHNGGQIVFGPDGYLYVGLGDGGSAGDPRGNGQNKGTLLGAILRLDVSSSDSTESHAIPADNPFVGVEGSAGGDMGIRPPQSVEVHFRPRNGRSVGGRRRSERAGRG